MAAASMRTNTSNGSRRGFAAMDESKQRKIASKGGAAVSRNRDHMAMIGRKGGAAVSRDRSHMAEIGRKGGQAVSRNRDHMAAIGKRGGESIGRPNGESSRTPPANRQ